MIKVFKRFKNLFGLRISDFQDSLGQVEKRLSETKCTFNFLKANSTLEELISGIDMMQFWDGKIRVEVYFLASQ